MTTIDFDTQVEELLNSVSDQASKSGKDLSEKLADNAYPILEWIHYLRLSETSGVADESLDGVQAAIIEVIGCLALGLVRPALFSLRAQIDMLLAWIYFKDHEIEWACVQKTGKGFKLKSEIISYLNEYIPNYKKRFALLLQTKARTEDEPYRLLSAHIHSQASTTIPAISNLKTLVFDRTTCEQCIQLQHEVTEYLSDILAAFYADKWASWPSILVTNFNQRLNDKQKTAFF